MSFAVDGIVSGFDTSAMIDAMVGVYAIPRDNLLSDVEKTNEKKEAVAGLMNRLETMDSALEDIEDETDFKQYKAEYEETSAFLVTTESGAVPGAYALEVVQLAQTELEASKGYADKTSTGTVREGTLTITYAGIDTDITIDSSNSSLSKVANAVDAIDGVSSYILDTGHATMPYVLIIQGDDTGADNTIEIDTSDLTGGSGVAPVFIEERSAQDAEIEINTITIVNDTNTFDDSIPGLDIEIYQETVGAEGVTVILDKEAMEASVMAVVDAYNEIIDWVDQKTSFNADLDIKGPFVGESTVRRVLRGLQSVISDKYESATEDIDSLSLMGFHTQNSGKLELDSEEFDDALDTYLDDVVAIFTDEDGFGAAMRDQIDVYIDPVDGTLESFTDSLEGRIDDLEDQVASYEYRIERYEARLRAQFAAMESLLGSMTGTSAYLAAYLNPPK